MHSALVISQADPRPMYLQLVDQISHKVAVGDWLPGQEIASIRALAVELRISVITVKRAYLELERAGVIVTRQGRGTFVAEGAGLPDSLKERELDQHLDVVAGLGRLLGLTDQDLQHRLAEAQRKLGADR